MAPFKNPSNSKQGQISTDKFLEESNMHFLDLRKLDIEAESVRVWKRNLAAGLHSTHPGARGFR